MIQLSIKTPVFKTPPALAPENHPDEIAELVKSIRERGAVNFDRLPRPAFLSDEECDTYRVKGIPVRAVRLADGPGWYVRYDVLVID